jgi:hypothetical protein
VTHRRASALLLVGILAALFVAGCSGNSPPSALPAEQAGKGVRYAALGGDDNVGGRDSFADAWPQQVFRSTLSSRSVFVDFADARSGSAEILASQVGPAVAFRPDVVTITLLDDAERGTDPAFVERDLREVMIRLARTGATILVGTTPAGIEAVDATAALDAAIRRASAGRATVVDLESTEGGDRESRAAAIARSFTKALPSRFTAR